MSADQIGIALKGRRNGSGWLVSCPCPNHGKGRGDKTPSLSVADGDDDRLLLRCFAGCDFLSILDELKYRGLINTQTSIRSAPARFFKPIPKPEQDPKALKLWFAAGPARNSVVTEYLDRRGITLPAPRTLRCVLNGPAMIAAVQRPSGKIIAVQTLALTPDGRKANPSLPRITTGKLGSGAVRLGQATDVLGISEGIETGLAAMQLTDVPVWASLGSERLHRVEIPHDVMEVHVFVDNDEPGRAAARRTAAAHTTAGRKVYLRSPPDQCGDWNDFLNLIADRDGRMPSLEQSQGDAA